MKRHAPATERNREPILEVLRRLLPTSAAVLEVGSGTGEHAAFFAPRLDCARWQPTDVSEEAIASIDAYRRESRCDAFVPPRRLDAAADSFPGGPWDAVFSANVIHISRWAVCEGIFHRAAESLGPAGMLVLYGPFRFNGEFTAASNAAFDARLRGECSEWGVRDVADLERLGTRTGFVEPEIIAMPANNHVLVFRRTHRGASR
jgi:SAM-dependent methyltransferase